ncbi:uncharacterized protein [Cherax quadricarinatus]
MTMYGQHEPSCEGHGRELVQGLPRKAKYPDFIQLQPSQEKCTKSDQDIEVFKPRFRPTVSVSTILPSIGEREQDKSSATTASSVPWQPPEDNEIERESLPQRDRNGVGRITVYLCSVSALCLLTIVF